MLNTTSTTTITTTNPFRKLVGKRSAEYNCWEESTDFNFGEKDEDKTQKAFHGKSNPLVYEN